MPIYVFRCEKGHKKEVLRAKPYTKAIRFRCKKCGLYQVRDYMSEHSRRKELSLDKQRDPLSHLVRKRSFNGMWIEHLTPEPVFVRDEKQYHDLLKKTNSREASRR